MSSSVVAVFIATFLKYHLIVRSARWEVVKVAIKIVATCQSWKAYSPVPLREVNIPSSILERVKYPNSNPKVTTSKTTGPLIELITTNNSRSALSLSARFVKIANMTRRSIANVTKPAKMRPAATAPMK